MISILVIALLTITSIIYAIKKQKLVFLSLPFLFLFIYFVVEVALVPAPFLDTVKFIFSIG
ncbi:hypothetical protein FZW96_08355 [Bacillus sp. BGMRC 2118]|nr:hypothetical protein FZW96_08355 [Bacillus sp. BGMRC 2118]